MNCEGQSGMKFERKKWKIHVFFSQKPITTECCQIQIIKIVTIEGKQLTSLKKQTNYGARGRFVKRKKIRYT